MPGSGIWGHKGASTRRLAHIAQELSVLVIQAQAPPIALNFFTSHAQCKRRMRTEFARCATTAPRVVAVQELPHYQPKKAAAI
jgi:hypothetical protein